MVSNSIILQTSEVFQRTTKEFVDNFMKIGVNPDLTDNMELNFEINKKNNCVILIDHSKIFYQKCVWGFFFHLKSFSLRNYHS